MTQKDVDTKISNAAAETNTVCSGGELRKMVFARMQQAAKWQKQADIDKVCDMVDLWLKDPFTYTKLYGVGFLVDSIRKEMEK